MADPRVSILIPNYNNGRASSKSGRRDFLGDLLRSLHETLQDDPTPLEIIIADDGSTDDSLDTARAWSRRTWGGRRGEQPFCRLIELSHGGVLSAVANRLTADARGEICCRLDGDIIVLTPGWAAQLVRIFEQGPPSLGIIGPKQLGIDGRIHSMGSWILHPRGHHHVAQGAPRESVTRSIEVDHVMGCFYCHRRAVWEQLDGYDENILRGQTVDFGLRARLAGWRAFAVPTIEFIHAHADRAKRSNTADTEDGIEKTLDVFREKWGFDRIAPDLAAVGARYAGTPLLWNVAVFGPAWEWPPLTSSVPDLDASEWGRYTSDEQYRLAVDARVQLALHLARQLGPMRRILHVRSRAGLLCHLLAGHSLECVGVDPDPNFVELSRTISARQTYPAERPQFIVQQTRARLPVENGSFDGVLLFDVLETHPNPVGLFAEAHRVLAKDGALAILTRERRSVTDGDHDAVHAYRPHEVVFQMQGTRCFEPVVAEGFPKLSGALVLFGRRRSEEQRSFHIHSDRPRAEVEAFAAGSSA